MEKRSGPFGIRIFVSGKDHKLPDMKRIALTLLALALCWAVPAQENAVLTRRFNSPFVYGGPTNPEGRSYNFGPTFFIYPDGKLTEEEAGALLDAMGIQPVLDGNFGSAVVINPTADRYSAGDFEVFKSMFDRFRSGNLKVIGFGEGATFVNRVVAPQAVGHIAGIVTVGGKPAKVGKDVCSPGVPAYVAGKNAAKVAKVYEAYNAAHADEPLLQVVVSAETDPGAVFADAWKRVLSRNYRFNNYKHTHYEGARYGEYGAYELEPYTDAEALGLRRITVELPVGGRGQRGPQENVPKWLWYEYWPEELLEGAPAHSVPVMVLLHGNMNDPRTQAETSGFLQVASEDRFFVVEMEWQGSVSYQAMGHDGIETVLLMLFDKYPQLDPSRVYAEGLSAGSMTATALGIKKSHVFTAVGGHSGGLMGGAGMGGFPGFDPIWNEATQKRGLIETPYCSVFGTMDNVVPYIRPDNWKGNGYLNAWNAYEQMNGMDVVREMDFSVDPVFAQPVRDRETIRTSKGDGIVIETGQLYKGDVPMIQLVAVMDYGHWNFQPTARIMWDFFCRYRRDPETKKLIYVGK